MMCGQTAKSNAVHRTAAFAAVSEHELQTLHRSLMVLCTRFESESAGLADVATASVKHCPLHTNTPLWTSCA